MASASQREGTVGEGMFYPRQAGARLRWQSMAKAERLPGWGLDPRKPERTERPVRRLLGQPVLLPSQSWRAFIYEDFLKLIFIYLAAPGLSCSAWDLQSLFPSESNLVAACGIEFPNQRQNWGPCFGSLESSPLDYQGSSCHPCLNMAKAKFTVFQHYPLPVFPKRIT